MSTFKTKIFLFLTVSLFKAYSVYAADTLVVPLNIRAIDDKFRKSQAIIPVFKYKGQPFEGITQFGIDTKKEPEKFYATLPDMTGISDTSYGFIFFGGSNNSKLNGYVFVIIGHNTRNMYPAKIWVDKNFNLDMSDDGPPDTFYNQTPFLDIYLKNPDVSAEGFICRISRFDFLKNLQYKMLLDDHYKNNSGSKIFAGADYSFREQRLNILAGDVKWGNDSFRLAIKDENCNGKFDEPGEDRILIGHYNQDELGTTIIEISPKTTWFERSGKVWKILRIDPSGKFITFIHDETKQIKNALYLNKKIPKVKYLAAEKQKKEIKIRKHRGKPLYLYFWNTSVAGFEEDTLYLRKIQNEFGNQIKILALNYGDEIPFIRGMKNKYRWNWEVGFSSLEINKSYFVESFPSSYITNKRQRLKAAGVSPKELYTRLLNGEKFK